MVRLDSLDLRILSLLSENSRLSLRRLASLLGVPHTTVYSRLRRLEEAGVIKGYTVNLDYSKLGYDVTVVIHMSVEGRVIEDIEERLARISNVVAVYDVTGEFDIIVLARFGSIGELDRFIKWLIKVPGVRRTITSIALRIVKEDFNSPLEGTLHPAT